MQVGKDSIGAELGPAYLQPVISLSLPLSSGCPTSRGELAHSMSGCGVSCADDANYDRLASV
jgi:hypothetical protein